MTEWEALREECLHCRACTLALKTVGDCVRYLNGKLG